MDNQTKTRMTIFTYIKEAAKALFENDEEFVNDIDEIPDWDKYKNTHADNEDIQNLLKIQRNIDTRKKQTQKVKENLNEQIKNPKERIKNQKFQIVEKEKED